MIVILLFMNTYHYFIASIIMSILVFLLLIFSCFIYNNKKICTITFYIIDAIL